MKRTPPKDQGQKIVQEYSIKSGAFGDFIPFSSFEIAINSGRIWRFLTVHQ
jgi:hypothetical protein